MAPDRYVILGVARPRAEWFAQLARWSNDGSLPASFIKCLDADEVVARAAGLGRVSMVVLDGDAHGVDLELFSRLTRYCALVVVVDDDDRRPWIRLGAHRVWPTALSVPMVRGVLETEAAVAGAATLDVALQAMAGDTINDVLAPGGSQVAVIGRSGAGTSTLAAALAQGLADDPTRSGRVCLADLALDASQALLHDSGDVIPGIQELAESHQRSRPSRRAVRRMTFEVENRRYDLLLGLRRPSDWPAVGPREFTAALSSLRRVYSVVVCDLDGTLEGESETGSVDVEERHAMARHSVATAEVVVVVGRPDVRGLHQLVRICDSVEDLGVDAARILPVLNRAPRSPQARAELNRTVAHLRQGGLGDGVPSTLFLPSRRHLERTHRDVARLPDSLCRPLRDAVLATLGSAGPATPAPEVPPLRLVAGE